MLEELETLELTTGIVAAVEEGISGFSDCEIVASELFKGKNVIPTAAVAVLVVFLVSPLEAASAAVAVVLLDGLESASLLSGPAAEALGSRVAILRTLGLSLILEELASASWLLLFESAADISTQKFSAFSSLLAFNTIS